MNNKEGTSGRDSSAPNDRIPRDDATLYNASFAENPYTRMAWAFEKSTLNDIITKYYADRNIIHLDFACGTGRILSYLRRYTTDSTGVDISPNMVTIARKNSSNATIFVADIIADDVLRDKKYNLITAFRFFPNAPPPLRIAALRALIAHMEDDGYLIFNNHLNAGSSSMYLHKLLGRPIAGHRMTMEEAQNLVNNSGLEIAKTYYVSILPGSERRTLLPSGLLNPIERVLRNLPFIQRLGANAIMVCRRTS